MLDTNSVLISVNYMRDSKFWHDNFITYSNWDHGVDNSSYSQTSLVLLSLFNVFIYFLQEKISDSSNSRQHLYDLGLQELQNNNVPYRKLRTKQVGCESDSEFLAKLFILRQALNVSMMHSSTLNNHYHQRSHKFFRIQNSVYLHAEPS